MSNSKTFQGPQRHSYSCHGLLLGSYRLGYVKFKDFSRTTETLLQLSWTVTGLIQIRLCQIQRLFKEHKGHSYSCHGLLLGSYRLGYVKFKDFSRTTETLLQLSWTVTGLIQIRLCQIQRLFKDHRDTPTVVMDCYWAHTD